MEKQLNDFAELPEPHTFGRDPSQRQVSRGLAQLFLNKFTHDEALPQSLRFLERLGGDFHSERRLS